MATAIFFQCVEGSEQALTNLKNDLLKDNRHQNMHILDFSLVDQRSFADWSMQTVVLEGWMLNDKRAKRLLPFRPQKWSDSDWQDFLQLCKTYYQDTDTAMQIDRASQFPAIQYKAWVPVAKKIIGEHQAFFAVQMMLGILMFLSVVGFLLW